MGSHAADAVWASMEEEMFLDENRDFLYEDGYGREPHPYFDSGCFDYNSLLQEESLRTLQLQLSNTMSDTSTVKYTPKALNSPKKYLPKMNMLLGMAKQVMTNKQLSVKQTAWMTTNWVGGGEAFERDVKMYGPSICQALNKIIHSLNRL